MYPQLDNGIHFRLNGINIIKEYFTVNICERETIS